MERKLRTDNDLIQALRQHIETLKDMLKFVEDSDYKYIKPISNILRLLVYKSRTCNPLLFLVAEKYSISPMVVTDSSKDEQVCSLREFLSRDAVSNQRKRFKLTNLEIIIKAAQQFGGAHEDIKVDDDVAFMRDFIPEIGKVNLLESKIYALAAVIVDSGDRILLEIEKKVNNGHEVF